MGSLSPSEADAAIVREVFRDVHEDGPEDPERAARRWTDLENFAVRAWPSLRAQDS